jgi:hypothetical protein
MSFATKFYLHERPLLGGFVPIADSRGILVFTQPVPIAAIELLKNQLH